MQNEDGPEAGVGAPEAHVGVASEEWGASPAKPVGPDQGGGPQECGGGCISVLTPVHQTPGWRPPGVGGAFPALAGVPNCRGPASADPGSSKWGRRRRGSGYNSFN